MNITPLPPPRLPGLKKETEREGDLNAAYDRSYQEDVKMREQKLIDKKNVRSYRKKLLKRLTKKYLFWVLLVLIALWIMPDSRQPIYEDNLYNKE